MGKCVGGTSPYILQEVEAFMYSLSIIISYNVWWGCMGCYTSSMWKCFGLNKSPWKKKVIYILWKAPLDINPSIMHSFIHFSTLLSVDFYFYHSNKVCPMKKPPHYHKNGPRHFSTTRNCTQEPGTFEGSLEFLCTKQSLNSFFLSFHYIFGRNNKLKFISEHDCTCRHLDPLSLHSLQSPCKPPAWSAWSSWDSFTTAEGSEHGQLCATSITSSKLLWENQQE